MCRSKFQICDFYGKKTGIKNFTLRIWAEGDDTSASHKVQKNIPEV